MLRLLRKGLWQMPNQQWNVCIPFARSNSSVPIATVCWDGWCSYSNREPTSMFIVKFLSHYLILLLPLSKLLKEEKIRVSLFFEWIKTKLKTLKLQDPLQTTGSYNVFPWYKSPHLMLPLSTVTGGHCRVTEKRAALFDEWCLEVCSFSRSHHTLAQHPVVYKPALPSGILSCFLPPTTHHFYLTIIL